MITTWIDMADEPPFVGPPKPEACIAGWFSHVWQLVIIEGSLSLSTDCRLCTDGLTAGDGYEYLATVDPIPVRLSFNSDHGPEGRGLGGWHGDVRCDCNVWFDVALVTGADDASAA